MPLDVVFIGVVLERRTLNVGLGSIGEIEVLNQLIEVSDLDGFELFAVVWELEHVGRGVLLQFLDINNKYFKSGVVLLESILFD